MRYRKNKRGWLRPARSTGPESTWHWDVEYHENGTEQYMSGGFHIRDCSSSVGLDCYGSKKAHLTKHIKAVNTLRAQLALFHDELINIRKRMK